jgi:hypothetical protein
MRSKAPSLVQMRKRFSYDPDTGQLKKLGRNGGIVKGATVRIDNRQINTIKLIWFISTGEWKAIFPLDGNHHNTKLSNLSPQRLPMSHPMPTVGMLQLKFTYDPETGDLYYDDKLVTTKDSQGYLCVNFLNRRYPVHRIIWKMLYGEEPDTIRHKDGVKTNNRLNNLTD